MRRRGIAAVVVAAVLGLNACSAAAPVPHGTIAPLDPVTVAPTAGASTPDPTGGAATAAPADQSAVLVAGMTRSQRAGQVLMAAGTVDELRGLAPLVRRLHLGGLMVRGRSADGTAAVAAALRPATRPAPDGLPLITATDQEGGLVQVLSGPGFETMPSAVEQGRRPVARLRSDAARWARSLAQAGIRLDLGPVADVPCAADLHDNPPIADLRRQYGSDPEVAGAHVAAFVTGMADGGVETAVKHFPGLGCVRDNTDTSTAVVDRATGADSARLDAFAAGVDAGAGFAMLSSASYARIDTGVPALFSPKVVRVLRSRLGFGGVIMSDDVGGAAALRAWSPGSRATRFVAAGGDLLLDIVPADLPLEHAALVSKATGDPAFDAQLTAAAERVVAARLRLRAHG